MASAATKKRFRDDVEVRVAVDQTTGDYTSFRRWQVLQTTRAGSARAPDLAVGAVKVSPTSSPRSTSRSRSSRSRFGRIGAPRPPSRSLLQKIAMPRREQT